MIYTFNWRHGEEFTISFDPALGPADLNQRFKTVCTKKIEHLHTSKTMWRARQSANSHRAEKERMIIALIQSFVNIWNLGIISSTKQYESWGGWLQAISMWIPSQSLFLIRMCDSLDYLAMGWTHQHIFPFRNGLDLPAHFSSAMGWSYQHIFLVAMGWTYQHTFLVGMGWIYKHIVFFAMGWIFSLVFL